MTERSTYDYEHSFNAGQVRLYIPKGLTALDVQDLEEHFALTIKFLKRIASESNRIVGV